MSGDFEGDSGLLQVRRQERRYVTVDATGLGLEVPHGCDEFERICPAWDPSSRQ